MRSTEQSSKPTAVIFIGLPGSGKSTQVKTITDAGGHWDICSADLFHMEDGVYNYRPTLAPKAHAHCLRQFIHACVRGVSVICDNTNVMIHNVAPYIAIAAAYEYHVRVIMCRADPNVAFERQIHAVPRDIHNYMRGHLTKMLESWPGIWPELEVVKT